MFLFYVLDRVIAKDVAALRRALPSIEVFNDNTADFDLTFYKTFVTLVIAHKVISIYIYINIDEYLLFQVYLLCLFKTTTTKKNPNLTGGLF